MQNKRANASNSRRADCSSNSESHRLANVTDNIITCPILKSSKSRNKRAFSSEFDKVIKGNDNRNVALDC